MSRLGQSEVRSTRRSGPTTSATRGSQAKTRRPWTRRPRRPWYVVVVVCFYCISGFVKCINGLYLIMTLPEIPKFYVYHVKSKTEKAVHFFIQLKLESSRGLHTKGYTPAPYTWKGCKFTHLVCIMHPWTHI